MDFENKYHFQKSQSKLLKFSETQKSQESMNGQEWNTDAWLIKKLFQKATQKITWNVINKQNLSKNKEQKL